MVKHTKLDISSFSQTSPISMMSASKTPGKRTASAAGLDGDMMSAPNKKQEMPLLLSQEEPTGHYCPICKDMIHMIECVRMFLGCGHMFHQKCTIYAKMKRCPVCMLKVGDSNPLQTMMFRIAKSICSLTTKQRIDVLHKAERDRANMAGMTCEGYYALVNSIVYFNALPKQCVVHVSKGTLMIEEFVQTPDRVYIYVKDKGTHIQNQCEVFRIMWSIFKKNHSKSDVARMFVNMTQFENFYV